MLKKKNFKIKCISAFFYLLKTALVNKKVNRKQHTEMCQTTFLKGEIATVK